MLTQKRDKIQLWSNSEVNNKNEIGSAWSLCRLCYQVPKNNLFTCWLWTSFVSASGANPCKEELVLGMLVEMVLDTLPWNFDFHISYVCNYYIKSGIRLRYHSILLSNVFSAVQKSFQIKWLDQFDEDMNQLAKGYPQC